MPRNIVIFSDGTGQRGGVLVDEDRSNIYKLYRATRCGPDSTINPSEQLAFYDAGIGTLPPGISTLSSLGRRSYNLISQALGLGLTGNMMDCYAALVRLWQPGDQIFLFGFSRGAYTIRCLAATICLCGIPTQMKNGGALRRDDESVKLIASEAVRQVYQHTSSWQKSTATPRQLELLDQRIELAKRFRREYRSGTDDEPNVYPHFIGVFDTVASLSNPVALTALVFGGLVLAALVSAGLWWLLPYFGWMPPYWALFLTLAGSTVGLGYVLNFFSRIRVAFGLEKYPWYRTLHLAEPRVNFYDNTLNTKVGFARHAISIDEARESFQRVRWGEPGAWKQTEPIKWFEQLWFAGNHSDVGGSYPENYSRLSDISLKWMLDAAVAAGLKHNPAYLNLFPDPSGPQHDETKSSVFKYAKKEIRKIGKDFPLHTSVIERFKAGPVLHYDETRHYRPENLRNHDLTKDFYK